MSERHRRMADALQAAGLPAYCDRPPAEYLLASSAASEAAERVLEARRAANLLVKIRGQRALEQLVEVGGEPTKKDVAAIARHSRRSKSTLRGATAALLSYAEALLGLTSARRKHGQAANSLRVAGESVSRDRGVRPVRGRAIRDAVTLAKGLDRARKNIIERCLGEAFSHGNVSVTWADDRSGIYVDFEEDWQGYSKKCKYPMRIWEVRVRAQKLLRSELPGGSREIGGLLTLAAEQLPSPDGETRMYRATWARKGAGVSWHIESGYIAVDAASPADPIFNSDIRAYHGRCAATALRGLNRRRRVRQADELRRRGISRDTAIAEYGDRKLSWRIARRAGLCAAGIRAWAERHFPHLDPMRDRITVREALETRSSEALVLDAVAMLTANKR